MGTTQKTIRYYWHANMRHKWLAAATATSWLIGMILQKLIMPLIAARAIDLLVQYSSRPVDNYWGVFLPYVIGAALAGISGQFFIQSGLFLLSKLETRVRPELQNEAFSFLIHQSLGFHANKFSGSLVAQVKRFVTSYIHLTDQVLLVGLKMLTNVVIAIIVIAFFSPLIAMVMSVWTILFVLLNIVLTKRRMKYSKIAAIADTTMTGHLADAIGNVSAVKSFANEAAEEAEHSRLAYDQALKKYRSWMAALRNDVVIGALMLILYITVLTLSIMAVMENVISIGTMLLIQVYITQLMAELWNLSNFMRGVEQSLSDAEEMIEVLDEPIHVTDIREPHTARIQRGEIAFKNMSFTHSDNKDDILFQNFNLHIKPGEKIGIVGHSGSGKTTLTRLLLRFSNIDDGEITIDGQSIATIRQRDLRTNISYVPQEPVLFHRSLRENIAYGKPSASLEEVKAAAARAHAAEFIEKLPRGYETLVGERGIKLSGGQRQRIAIARAILKDAPILVLDEATSALDSESEKLIQSSLKELMKKRTSIVIAHRLSTIQQMDRIVVLENGVIAEQGSHAELLKNNGIYADLWKHQSGGFIAED